MNEYLKALQELNKVLDQILDQRIKTNKQLVKTLKALKESIVK